MSWGADFVIIIGILVALLLGGMWVPFAIGVSGLVSIYLVDGWGGMNALGLVSWGSVNSFTLTAIPLFILMAEILLQSGVSQRFYQGLTLLVRGLPGGLMQTNISGCALFAAISGSSVATAAAIGTVALPQLEKRGYDRRMAAGSLAAGGTLGILIPPSIAMIIYGTFTEVSISKLFMAGFIPGFVLAFLFMLYIAVRAWLRPSIAPREEGHISGREKLAAALELVPFIVLIVSVLGSIYAGIATPTEAAAVGCSVAIVISLIWGKFGFAELNAALTSTVRVSCTIIFIVFNAMIFSYAVENAGIGTNLTNWFTSLGLNRYAFFFSLVVMYCILGCLIDSIGMIVLTVPLLFGSIVSYGFDPVWFGVMLVLLLELGMITPPFGINLFVIQSISKWPLGDVVRGSVPYWAIILLYVAFLTAFPDFVTWLPAKLAG
ncbi:MAG: TRAP transporter large permease [Rhizobiales bacterium]|nr:TRAP transporter large permease [Hyphomicrobiales bacterium]